jgi:two-component system NtrC family sensor kinase
MQQLQAAQEQLLRSEKLAALGEMSAKVAHEVNNPLGIIKNYLLLLKRKVENDPEPKELVGVVTEEIDRIAGIVKQLLEFHRPQPIPREEIEINDLLGSLLSFMRRQLKTSGIEMTRDFSEDHLIVDGSPELLKQVFMNIIINARQAMSDGGHLTITTTLVDDEIAVRFCDTGPGIPSEHITRIFEPFFTTKDPGEGTGLGLSVCYGIITKHDGSIRYRNLEQGGCFEIRLPRAESNRELNAEN